jgi:hypothetical protein
MANERLRAAIFSSRFDVDDVAHELGVDRKTVERWIAGRVPYKRHRYALASLLGADPAYLWPVDSAVEASDLALAEVLAVYPVRSTVGNDAWVRLFEQAHDSIDVLVYAGFWLSEDPAIRRLLVRKAKSGVRLRFLLGDPDCAEVRQRGLDEGIGSAISAKIANTVHNYREVIASAGVEFRQHATVLYNSIYRADDEMLINTHLYGLPAHMTPLLHLRRVPGAELFATYNDSFERVWSTAVPLETPLSVAG